MDSAALWQRAQIVQSIRDFFQGQGFLEVETPVLIPANAPEEYIDPIAVSPLLYLQTSPELCMKRLLCRGHKRLFQICRCWRSGERGSRHLSEFTMLEWYRADSDYHTLMSDCEQLLRHISSSCHADHVTFRWNSKDIHLQAPWERIPLQEAFHRFADADIIACMRSGRYEEVLSNQVEAALARFDTPVFLTDFPAELAALARLKPGEPHLAERFELYLGGLELANGFSELNDPDEQRQRFIEANRVRMALGKAELPLPHRFLEELERMPPAAGIALGVDRLVMLATGADTIDDVIAFTPEML